MHDRYVHTRFCISDTGYDYVFCNDENTRCFFWVWKSKRGCKVTTVKVKNHCLSNGKEAVDNIAFEVLGRDYGSCTTEG